MGMTEGARFDGLCRRHSHGFEDARGAVGPQSKEAVVFCALIWFQVRKRRWEEKQCICSEQERRGATQTIQRRDSM